MLAIFAFASNSLLCRMAFRNTSIDVASFTSLRLVSGAITLWIVARATRRRLPGAGNWGSALALLVYALAFSLAYVKLPAGTGALLLFGAVQMVMIGSGLLAGERFGLKAGLGWGLAVAGLVLLMLPGLSAPPPREALLMVLAGIAWGAYSLRGRRSADALRDTAGNFMRAAPGALLASVLLWPQRSWDPAGAALAVMSGSLASGLGYVAWYTALPRLSAIAAGNAQLAVPVIAALGGVVMFGEAITVRLLAASAMVLGGVTLALNVRKLER
jgi:drug/metabolite transporter (DMT)-like permease